jgi:4-alpha-glucanotransferase
LPGPWSCGNLGDEAFRFIEFLAASGQSLWQMLPLGVPHADGSPYQCLSVFAGNPALISPESLRDSGWLDTAVYDKARQQILEQPSTGLSLQAFMLEHARDGFTSRATNEEREALATFIEQQGFWLHDYALYQSLHQHYQHQSWTQWPPALRDRQPQAVAEAREQHAGQIAEVCFEQFVFFRQWQALKDSANHRGVLLFGDMPIFIAHDSADVWCAREYFDLYDNGQPRTVTGVPPDYFSDTGQHWGNPHYRWDVMVADDFSWWKQRLAMQLQLFDVVRIDHFRGFEASWEIPAEHETAMNGVWIPVPGEQLFDSLLKHFGSLPLVAEDLGIITPAVEALRDRYQFPGMKILQFAFGGDNANPYLPHHHVPNCVVYTGTHDNDTTLGWWQALDEHTRAHVHEYLGIVGASDMPWPLIRAALESVANTAIFPLQDALSLDSSHRMNIPGTAQGNWRWRFDWQDVPPGLAEKLHHLTALYQRLPSQP